MTERTKTAGSVYRCAECRHGRHLTAWGSASVHGPLGADGEIDYCDWDEVWQVHEVSIQCTSHPGAVLEKFIGGLWCRWWSCPRCTGDGRGGYCPEDGIRPADGDGKRTAHSGWWPIDEPWPVSTVDRNGHVFTPGRNPHCRYCQVDATSIAGREMECEGDQHECPVIVEAGATETARQPYRSGDWLCLQPGKMNDDFTEWRCSAGHVITSDYDRPHKAAYRSPWLFLAAAKPGKGS